MESIDKDRAKLIEFAAPVLFSVGVLLVWELLVSRLSVPNYLLPSPSAIIRRLIQDGELFFRHSLVTLYEAVLGFLLASVFGITAAILIAHSTVIERTLYPYTVMAKVIPIVSVAPLLMLWLGFGVAPKIIIAALVSFFPIVVNTVEGLKSTDVQMVRLMQSLSASPLQIFYKIRLPFSLPYVFAAFKISITLSVVGAVVGELVGADKGLGHLIMIAEAYLDTEMMFSAVVISAVLGISLFSIVSLVEKHFVKMA